MRHYERYLLSNLLGPAILITASLTGIVWLTQILRFLDFILNRGLSLFDFLYLTGLMLPSLLLFLTPVTLCIAVIYTYNKLTVESELIVLNAVGVSKWQLARPAIMLGVMASCLCFALALYIMPLANQRFKDIRTLFRDKYASILLEEEVFNSPMDGVTVFVRERDSQNHLAGIVLHDSRDPKQTITMIAEEGKVEQTAAGPRFYLQHGIRQQWKEGRVSWLAFDDYAIEIAFYGKAAERTRGAEERTIGQLFQQEGLTDKQRATYRAEINQRLTWPLLCLTLPLFALATLFSTEFSRRGQAKRMVVAGIGVALVAITYFACRNLSVRYAWMGAGLYILVVGLIGLSCWVMATGRMVQLPAFPSLRFWRFRKAAV